MENREKIGYAMLAVTAIYFLINLIPVLVNMVIFCKKSVKRKILLRQIKREQVRIKNNNDGKKINGIELANEISKQA